VGGQAQQRAAGAPDGDVAEVSPVQRSHMALRTKFGTFVDMITPILDVRFFADESGNEPVREWLKTLPASERRTIGEDIKTVQFGWPRGMPLVRKLAKDLSEVRIHLMVRIARVLFTVVGHTMVLLHGFIKKSQATPPEEHDVAKQRLQQLRSAS
jgi:phage-related protein